jgi:hypothetical protein
MGAFAAYAANRAFRLYLFLPPAKKGYRFNPLRGPKIAVRGDFGH